MNNQNAENNSNELISVENKYWKDLYLALKRLHDNVDFQKVVLEGYFKDKAINGVSMLAHTSTIREGRRGEIFESLIAVSQLQDYFIMIANLGADASGDDDEGFESNDSSTL